MRRFGADPRIVGQSIVLDGEPVTVIGVLPPSFDFEGTFSPGRPADLFLAFPLALETDRRGNLLALIGRLKNNARLGGAQAEATAIAASLPRTRMDGQPRNRFEPTLSPLRDRVSGRFRTALLALAGAVGFLMLLVCANLSNLLLVRASVRRREMAIRSALGAAPRQLIRQMLIESLVLGAGGALLGLVIAAVATASVSRLQGTVIPLLREVRVDGVVFTFTAVLAIVTGIAFGLLPALQTLGVDVRETLAEESRGSAGRRSGWLRRAVVVAELAMACVLLTGAGLLTRSLSRVLDVEPGYATENVIALRVDQPRAASTGAERRAYLDGLVRTVSAVPGVAAVALTDALPLGDNFGWRRWGARAVGQPVDSTQRERPGPLVRMVDAGYFATMGIPIRSGSGFTTSDVPGSEPVSDHQPDARRRAVARAGSGRPDDGGGRHSTPRDRRRRRRCGTSALDRDVEREMYFPIGHSGGLQLGGPGRAREHLAQGRVSSRACAPRSVAPIPTCRSRISARCRSWWIAPCSPAIRRHARRRVRGVRCRALRAGDLRRDLVFGEPADAGDRDPDGVRRDGGWCASQDPRGDRASGRRGARARPAVVVDGGAGDSRAPVRRAGRSTR